MLPPVKRDDQFSAILCLGASIHRTPVLQSSNMALELNKLTKDVDALGQNLAERLAQLAERLPAAQASLTAIGVADHMLRRKIEPAPAFRWAGPNPTPAPG